MIREAKKCVANNIKYISPALENNPAKHGGCESVASVISKSLDFERAYDECLKRSVEFKFIPDFEAYFDGLDFGNLMTSLRETSHLDGDVVEIGTYKGGSASLILTYLRTIQDKRKVYFLDTYAGFTYDAALKSADSWWANSHDDTSMGLVNQVLGPIGHPYELVRTNVCDDPVPAAIQKISMINIDVDLYEAVKAALVKFAPLVQTHGFIVCEDYGHTPRLIGAALAVEEFLDEGARADFIKIYMESGQLLLIKK